MDTMRTLARGHTSDPRDDSGVEPPPMIGLDERRMQVRAYNHWAALLSNRMYPAIEDLDLENLGDFGPNSVLLDFTSSIEKPAISFIGDALTRECCVSSEIHYIDEVPRGSLLSRLTDHYLQIIANRAPIGFEAEFQNDRGQDIAYRGILLPFSSDDDTIDFMLGVINWKEAADVTEAQAIQSAVKAVMSRPAPAAVVMPLWADGPAATHFDVDDDGDDDTIDDLTTEGDEVGMGVFAPRANEGKRKAMILTRRDDEAVDDLPEVDDVPGADSELGDWLAYARDMASRAQEADSRSHTALYEALSRGHDFALEATKDAEGFAALLHDANIAFTPKTPMTAVIRLVFGATYDKTRVAEYAAVLTYARQCEIGRGALATYIAHVDGGLKGMIKLARARKRGTLPVSRSSSVARASHKLRQADALATVPVAASHDFVILVGRRGAEDGTVDVVAVLEEQDALLDRVLTRAVR